MLLLLLFIMSAIITTASAQTTPRVLVYTATRGYRHDSIPTAIEVLRNNAATHGVEFAFTEDPAAFNNSNLATFDGVMFVSNSEEVLDASGQEALATFFRSGGVYTGVHSATLFDFHPSLQQAFCFGQYGASCQAARLHNIRPQRCSTPVLPNLSFMAFVNTFTRLNMTHPATAPVPDRWTFEEEVYYFRSDPRSVGAQVLLSVDEASYKHDASSAHSYPSMGDPHPIAWYITSPKSAEPLAPGAPKAGRSFYTSLGHNNSTWRDETFLAHVFGGLVWALEGASTRAYGVGLVGAEGSTNASASGNGTAPNGSTSAASAPGTTSAGGASTTGTGTGGTSGANRAGQNLALCVGVGVALAAGLSIAM